tara:strand:+ start:1308 stop:1541 length:234 start_codon:yes stop_codon:yes gene_type:complete
MCIICVQLDKNELSPWEAKANLKEISEKIGPKHTREVENKISDAIFEEINLNYGDTLDEEVDFSLFCKQNLLKSKKN